MQRKQPAGQLPPLREYTGLPSLSPQLHVGRPHRSLMTMGKPKPREGQQWAMVTQHLELSRAKNAGPLPPDQGFSTSFNSLHWPKPLPFY